MVCGQPLTREAKTYNCILQCQKPYPLPVKDKAGLVPNNIVFIFSITPVPIAAPTALISNNIVLKTRRKATTVPG